MTIAKGLALVSVLWNLSGNSEAPFLEKHPTREPEAQVSAPRPEPSVAPVAPVPVAVPSPVPVAAAPAAPRPLGPQAGPVLAGIHVTGWVSLSPQRMASLIESAKRTGMTAIVFEVKDVNGDLFFRMQDGKFKDTVKACHDAGLQVIARFCVFKDKQAEEAHPGMRYGNNPGTNRRHKPWTDPRCQETVDYNIKLLVELVRMGVDEVNLDYIRFPSAPEGVRIEQPLPVKCKAIAEFVRQARIATKGVRLSLDVFGYVAWDENSARVGQRLEDLAPHVDGIYPMLYPDHFARGDLGFKDPVQHPYEVIRRGCEAARNKKGMERVAVVPWIQTFSLDKDSIAYGAPEYLAQIQGARDAGIPSWLAWNPKVSYDELFRAMSLAKGRGDLAPLCRKYIPARYARTGPGEEEGDEADPAAASKPGEARTGAAIAGARAVSAPAEPAPAIHASSETAGHPHKTTIPSAPATAKETAASPVPIVPTAALAALEDAPAPDPAREPREPGDLAKVAMPATPPPIRAPEPRVAASAAAPASVAAPPAPVKPVAKPASVAPSPAVPVAAKAPAAVPIAKIPVAADPVPATKPPAAPKTAAVPSAPGAQPEAAPASPFGGAAPLAGSAPVIAAKKPANATKPAKRKPRKAAKTEGDEVSDDSMDAQLYRYTSKK